MLIAGKLCIEVTPQSKIVWISESLCIGCGICIKVMFPLVQTCQNVCSCAGRVPSIPSHFYDRNVHLERCRLLTCPATWRRKPHTDTAPIPLNCTGTTPNITPTPVMLFQWPLPINARSISNCVCLWCACLLSRRLPIPRPGEVLGLVGTNGIGKSTALKILAGKQKPNLGKYDVSVSHMKTDRGGHVCIEVT